MSRPDTVDATARYPARPTGYDGANARSGWQEMADNGRSHKSDTLAAELAAGRTVRDAATAAGVSERTAYRRLSEHPFAARVAELRAAMVGEALGRLSANMGRAADVLAALLDDDDPGVRQRAAAKLIELGLRVREQVELEGRVRELERALERPGGRS